MKISRWILLLIAFLFAAGMLVSCASNNNNEDDDTTTDDDTGDDDSGDDDTGTDDDTSSPVLTHSVDEVVSIPGLSAEARVALDKYAIPYIFAATESDLMIVLGYMEARQRFFQIDFLRHTFEGRLTEYLWDLPLDNDLYYRVIFMANDGTSVLDKIVEGLDETTRNNLQAYADGVNAWLNEKRQQHPLKDWPKEYNIFFLKPDNIPDWEVRDTIAVARYQTWDLSSTLDEELSLTDYAEALPPDLYEKVFSRAMATTTTVLPTSKGKGAQPPVGAYHSALPKGYKGLKRALNFVRNGRSIAPLSHNGKASNNWIVSPAINNGVGYLANDPHLNLTYPSIFMLGYIDNEELGDGSIQNWGSIFPGTPAIVIGTNKNMAWGETVAGYDVTDVYAETLILEDGKPKKVIFKGNQVDLIESIQQFTIRGSSTPTEISVYVVPHHGPILPDSIDGTTAMSFRWTGHEPTFEIETFLGLRTATKVDEGFTAILNFQVGAQNFVLQDTAGDIGYFPNGKVPIRHWNFSLYKPWHVLPGDGTTEWDGYIPGDEMPKAKNPSRGFLVTANNDINGSAITGDPTSGKYYWYFSTDIGYRAQRIDELLTELAGGTGFSMDSMQKVQLDIHSNYAGVLIPMVLDAIGEDATGLSGDAHSILEYWRNWDYELNSGLAGTDPSGDASSDLSQRSNSVAAMGFAQFETRLREKIFADEILVDDLTFPYGYDELLVSMINLQENDPLWDNIHTDAVETRRDTIVSALNEAAADLALMQAFGGLPVSEWYWGRIHNLRLGHIAFSALGIDWFDLGPYAIPGGMHTVNVADYAENGQDYVVENGPSLRIIHEFSDGNIKTHLHYPGGQIPVSGDPHQKDILDLWLAGEYYEMPHDVNSILNSTVTMISFTSQ